MVLASSLSVAFSYAKLIIDLDDSDAPLICDNTHETLPNIPNLIVSMQLTDMGVHESLWILCSMIDEAN